MDCRIKCTQPKQITIKSNTFIQFTKNQDKIDISRTYFFEVIQEIYETISGAQSMVQKDIKNRGAPAFNRVEIISFRRFLRTKMNLKTWKELMPIA